ncbi:hypothetical protein BGP_2575 [Beggiatoa sp. PS]|nr:hypothetical protein BGP_2575 [Beggiatoa sp. PS]
MFGFYSAKKILEIPELVNVGWVDRSETHPTTHAHHDNSYKRTTMKRLQAILIVILFAIHSTVFAQKLADSVAKPHVQKEYFFLTQTQDIDTSSPTLPEIEGTETIEGVEEPDLEERIGTTLENTKEMAKSTPLAKSLSDTNEWVESPFFLGIKSVILSKWTRTKYTTSTEDNFLGIEKEAETEKDALNQVTLIGPEFKYYFLLPKYSPFIRGFLLSGNQIDLTGMDIGWGKTVGMFLGYRNLKVTSSKKNLGDYKNQGIVVGSFVRYRPNKVGFNLNLEVALNNGGGDILDTLSNIIQMEQPVPNIEEPLENKWFGEAEFTVGYQFETLPLNLTIGYQMWEYYKPSEYNEGNDETYTNDFESGHGITIRAIYSF